MVHSLAHRLLARKHHQSLVQLLGGSMKVGDLVKDITGLIGIVKMVDVDFVKTTFGWVKKENLEVLS
mgnify:CR=1 FL=1